MEDEEFYINYIVNSYFNIRKVILLLGTSISFVNKAYGIPDVDIAALQKQMYAMQETLTKRMGAKATSCI